MWNDALYDHPNIVGSKEVFIKKTQNHIFVKQFLIFIYRDEFWIYPVSVYLCLFFVDCFFFFYEFGLVLMHLHCFAELFRGANNFLSFICSQKLMNVTQTRVSIMLSALTGLKNIFAYAQEVMKE